MGQGTEESVKASSEKQESSSKGEEVAENCYKIHEHLRGETHVAILMCASLSSCLNPAWWENFG